MPITAPPPAWANVRNKPSTIAGFGITDVNWGNVAGKPTTVGGYGITDMNWGNVSGKPTTVAGYGITDMGSQSVNYAGSAGSAGAVAWGSVSGKPTTVGGYGITDMGGQSVNYAGSSGAVAWGNVSGKPSTVGGYGISDFNALAISAQAGASVGGVGTYAFLGVTDSATTIPGDVKAGSSLRYANVQRVGNTWGVNYDGAANTSGDTSGYGPSGTWRCMGHSLYVSNRWPATLWMRIS